MASGRFPPPVWAPGLLKTLLAGFQLALADSNWVVPPPAIRFRSRGDFMNQAVAQKAYKGVGMEGFTAGWYASLTYKALDEFKALPAPGFRPGSGPRRDAQAQFDGEIAGAGRG